jgi:hypothetical protein
MRAVLRRTWAATQVALLVAAVFLSVQTLRPVQRAEFTALAQACGYTPGSTLKGNAICQTVGQVLTNGLQVGASGFPVSIICAVTGTLAGTAEVDVTPSCSLPTSTAPAAAGNQLAEVFCDVAGAGLAGGAVIGFIKNATQVGMQATTPTTATATCLIVGH